MASPLFEKSVRVSRQLLERIEALRLLRSDCVLEVLNLCLMKEFRASY